MAGLRQQSRALARSMQQNVGGLTRGSPRDQSIVALLDSWVQSAIDRTMNVFEMVAQTVLSAPSDAIIAADKNGHIVFWNPGAERMFGHSAAAALGQSLDLIIPEQLRERHWRGYERVMETGASRYGEGDILAVPGVRSDGSRISLEFTIAPMKGEDGQLLGLAAVLRDVTPRFEELRALRRKLADSSKPSS